MSGLLIIFKRIKLVASTQKKNKIIGTHEISFKFPNSAKPKIARQLRTQYVESIYRLKYYTVTLKSRLRSLKVTNRTIG